MWIKTSECTPDQGDVVIVRFNRVWDEDEWVYDYAVAYYEGCKFTPHGVEAVYDKTVNLQFTNNPIITEWKETS